jgi:hypothetical protein
MKNFSLALALAAVTLSTFTSCAGPKNRSGSSSSSGSDARVYSPQTRDYEWRNSNRSPTSPGADTRRSSNF